MPVLSNPRHEMFAQALAKGMSQTEAYAEAGYEPKRQNASRLMTNDDVVARVRELQERVAARVVGDQVWVLAQLMEVTERCMQHEPVRDREGNETGEYIFNASGATKALELIGKHLGMFQPVGQEQPQDKPRRLTRGEVADALEG